MQVVDILTVFSSIQLYSYADHASKATILTNGPAFFRPTDLYT